MTYELVSRLPMQCGVDVDQDPRETWLATVKERLRADLEAFRNEFDPISGHGWMCRLTYELEVETAD